MTEASEFSQFLVEMEQRTNLAESDYTISFSTPFPLTADDVLYITFPDEVELPSEVECEPGNNLERITCSNTGNQLTVEFDEIDDSDGLGDFAFAVLFVTNPPSTEQTSSFSEIYLVSGSSYEVAQFTQENIQVYTKTAAELDNYSLSQSSYAPSDEATYVFKFTPNSPIPKNGVFKLTLPDQVGLSSK